ncbi:MAG TPA: c-type cytochrome [Candidatus Azoamicus sp. MARI]
MAIRNVFLIFFIFVSASLFANNGKDIFDRFCTACHSPSMSPMFGSPALHDVAAWDERKNNAFDRAVENEPSLKSAVGKQKEEISLKELVNSAISGTDKGMPPKGTCNDCTDDDLKTVIKFMSSAQ